MSAPSTDRVYLFVPPEEAADARTLGAHFDAATKRWYVDVDLPVDKLARWLPSTGDEEEFTIESYCVFVAAATAPCQRCGSPIEVICLYCEGGKVFSEPLSRFTVSDISEVDDSLSHQLAGWPNFRKATDQRSESAGFANHCPHCGARQDDMLLHSEPEHPFFDVSRAGDSVTLTPLGGVIRLSGDEHFLVD
jgi:hypothetical protein